jgi:hypothetical protein
VIDRARSVERPWRSRWPLSTSSTGRSTGAAAKPPSVPCAGPRPHHRSWAGRPRSPNAAPRAPCVSGPAVTSTAL